ncbi:MAG: T9SS type A sorting domain-containing protein [Bacteroidetes bacterium]|nr:T9SS type A sorting domain-containing protein [Bacteroidota bacterium]
MKNKVIWNVACNLPFLLPCFLYAQGIEIQAGATMEASGNPTIEITDGNFVNNGTYTKSSETFILSGTSAGTISGSGNLDLYIFTLNNSSGITLSGSLNLTISNSLVLTNGRINTGSNAVIIGNNATVSGAGTTRYINGNCWKTGSQAFTFPVGNNGKYAPLGISSPGQATDQFTVSYSKSSPNAIYNTSSLGAGINHVSTCEYWTVNRTNGNSDVAVTLSWDTGSCGITNLNELNVARWDGSNWIDAGNAGTTGTSQSGTITSNTESAFGPFILASSTSRNPLPIGLLNFNARKKNEQVQLLWSTSSETNNDYFSIERSTDFSGWEKIGRVKGAGNSTVHNEYGFTDIHPENGIQYYRLIQTDYDGRYTCSEIRTVDFSGRAAFTFYPSPAHDAVTVTIRDKQDQNTTIRLLTLDGQTIPVQADMNENVCVLDVSKLVPGFYLVEVSVNGNVSRLKLVKN